ncbi:MAG: large subunit ribosomal protein L17 [Algoriphagus sp.]|jgi:large subunit ribosomal protein L17
MRHGKKINHLGRTKSHRVALLSNMAASLIANKRITTTLAKAKSLRKYAEPLITRSKNDTTHSRRIVFSYLQDKEALKELFGIIAEKVAERNGGYTRIIKLGTRYGDNAEMALIELVDFNDNLTKVDDNSEGEAKTTRRRRGGKKASTATDVDDATSAVEVVEKESPTQEVAEEGEKTEEKKD